MYRFAARPKWILSHILVLVLVVTMINLGFWQLRRLDQKKSFNALVHGREAEPPAPLPDVLAADATYDDAKSVTYRPVEANGTYDVDEEVVVRSRSLDERPGAWVLTPLVLDDGTAVLVNRGWFGDPGIPDHAPAEAAPPTGRVDVTGLLMPTQTRGLFGPKDPTTGNLSNLARADVGRVRQQVPYDLYPAYIQLSSQDPPQPGVLPIALEPPVLDEGPHLSYAVQWFTFTLIAIVGYVLILRRAAAHEAKPPLAPGPAPQGDEVSAAVESSSVASP
jgi:surfeit locus 1 family protein